MHYSFTSDVAAVVEKPARTPRKLQRPNLPSRRYMRNAMETFGLFAFGFGSTVLVIHFVVGIYLAARLSSMLPPPHM